MDITTSNHIAATTFGIPELHSLIKDHCDMATLALLSLCSETERSERYTRIRRRILKVLTPYVPSEGTTLF